jgi:hypothetical protein
MRTLCFFLCLLGDTDDHQMGDGQHKFLAPQLGTSVNAGFTRLNGNDRLVDVRISG